VSVNPFEAGIRKLIPAVLVYARHEDEILFVHRDSPDRPGDYHAGLWNGLGGKLELDESPLDAAVRELAEESGLVLAPEFLTPLGFLTFPNFKPHKSEDWFVTVFEAQVSAEERRRPVSGPEGSLHWVGIDRVPELPTWPGDRAFLPHVIRRSAFCGTIWYSGREVLRSWITPLAPLG
jgi:8-oxo-dGTP diphosphatase